MYRVDRRIKKFLACEISVKLWLLAYNKSMGFYAFRMFNRESFLQKFSIMLDMNNPRISVAFYIFIQDWSITINLNSDIKKIFINPS